MKDSKPTIKVFYGATWCADCVRSKAFLAKHNIDYKSIDIDEQPEAAAEVERINDGYKTIPTILFSDGSKLLEPSDKQLAEKLGL